MASSPEEVRRAALQEMARRELARRRQGQAMGQSGDFSGPIPTGAELAASRAPKTEGVMRKLGLLDVARATMSPTQQIGLGIGEAALSVGTGMASAPLNSLWNAGMEASELPTGQPVPTYTPRSPEGQAIVDRIGKVMQPVAERIERWTGLQDPDPAVRATGNLMNAAAGLAPGVGVLRGARVRRASIPTRAEIKDASAALYSSARGTGEMLPQSGFSGLIQKAEKMLADESFDPGQHPRTKAALDRLYEEGTRPGIQGFSPQGAEIVRRHLMNAEEAALGDIKNPAIGTSQDARLAAKLLDDFDDFMDQELAKAGPQYQNARRLWSTQLKSAEIERLFERAKNQAGQFSISGMENALRSQFKSLADSRRFNRFNADEKEAILRVVRGGPLQNTLRFFGKFFPNGTIPFIAASSAENLVPGAGMALAAGGAVGRGAAAALRTRSARRVDELVRSGALPIMGPSRIAGSQSFPQLGYLPANALATREASNALRDERERRNALTQR